MGLLDAFHAQGFAAHRVTYLSKQILALATVRRKQNGDSVALEYEVARCFDIRPTWIPETQFEQGQALLDELLPGEGSIFDRSEAPRKRYELPREKSRLLMGFMQRAMVEARRRVQAFVEMRQSEEVELAIVTDAVFKRFLTEQLCPSDLVRA